MIILQMIIIILTIKCTDYENFIDIIIPTLLLTKPCGVSFLCLMSLMIYALVKSLLR